MSNQLEKIKIEFNNLIRIYQGVLVIENPNRDILKEIMNIALEYRNNYMDFCKIIKEHFIKDDTKIKIRLFDIIDSLFKSDVGDLYINQIKNNLYENFKECFTVGDFDERVLLFKIFYTWKYIIPNDIYELIKTEEKLDDFKITIFMKKFPGKIKKYDDYNNQVKQRLGDKLDINKNITHKNFKEDELMNQNNINNNDQILSLKIHDKVKQTKLLGKKKKSTHTKSENENTTNKKKIVEKPINNNNNINQTNLIINPNNNFNLFLPVNVSPNEIKLFIFLSNNKSKLSKNIPLFSSIAKYYSESLFEEKYSDNFSHFKAINENEEIYKEIRKRMKIKLFQETIKNNCAICGFRTLFYNDLVRHLDIHFNFNLLEMEGKNLFRKNAWNKNNWIYGRGEKNLKNKINEIDSKNQNDGTLENLIFYRNMMNNNLIKINNEQEEDNEEFMYPINDDNRKICHYCGDDFKKIFSTKYNYWFYNKVVVVIDEKNKFLAHQACFEELSKKIKLN